MVKIKGRITKIGNSYGIIVSKSLIDSEILREREIVELELIDSDYIKYLAKKYNKKALSEIESRDYRGMAGFPDFAV